MKKILLFATVLFFSTMLCSRTISITSGGQTTSYNLADIQNISFDSTATTPDGFILVEGGSFNMGDASYATPIHSVTLNSFYIGKYEVTQSEWQATMNSNPSNHTGDLSRPVEMVSWYDVLVYCNKRSIAEGLTPCYSISNATDPASWGIVPTVNNAVWNAAVCNWSANGYRLASEAEWEFAARGGNSSQGYLYSGSNTVGDVAWCLANASDTTHPVGLKDANELGIYDMTGNVFEWNWDWYAVYTADAQTNPTGPLTGASKMCRGGSYSGNVFYNLNSTRFFSTPFGGGYALGFRLARSL